MKYIIILLIGLSLISCEKSEVIEPSKEPVKEIEIRQVIFSCNNYKSYYVNDTKCDGYIDNKFTFEKGAEISLKPPVAVTRINPDWTSEYTYHTVNVKIYDTKGAQVGHWVYNTRTKIIIK